jgi:hypothetical protein
VILLFLLFLAASYLQALAFCISVAQHSFATTARTGQATAIAIVPVG